MKSNDYQQLALRTEKTPKFIRDEFITSGCGGPRPDLTVPRLLHSLLGLMSETGELADALKKHLIYGADLDYENVLEEYGDILWYVALGLHGCGFGMDLAMRTNIAKLKARYGDKFTEEAALNRDLDAEAAAMKDVDNA